MIPNNNLSVLPWYTSIEQQNARRWWVYNRIYPLFVPAGILLPFQVLREPLREKSEIFPTTTNQGYVPLLWDDGFVAWEWAYSVNNNTDTFSVVGISKLYVENLKPAEIVAGADYYGNVVFLDNNDAVVSYLNLGNFLNSYTGFIDVPTGATKVMLYDTDAVFEVTDTPQDVESFKIYTANGELYADVSANINIAIKALDKYDCLIYAGQVPFISSMENGQYYAVMSDGTNTWYSEIVTVVNDISPYLKIEWWDIDDFVMDAGTIVYKYAGGTQFKNVLYLQAEIAKPEYIFDEEGETRDGYFFPTKQISEKKYRFSFLASEYLLDVMRFIRMADYAEITNNGQRYSLDTFLITPEWEDNGDVAAVDAEFNTATVAKKIGLGYIKAQRGDFNDDFNNDFNNQQS